MKLTNRTILITGGASGIGFAMAKWLISKNNTVIVCSRNQANLDWAKLQLPTLETRRCDINSANDLNTLTSYLMEKYPKLDTLINNAGIQQPLDLTNGHAVDRAILHEISTNLTAHINITQRLYSLISSNANPTIIFIGSALAFTPKYSAPIYSAAKAGLHSYVQSLRHHSQQDGLRIVEIFPGVVATQMTHNRPNEPKMDPDDFVSQTLKQLEANKQEIFIGRTKLLSWLNRLIPTLALKVINNQRD